MYSRIIFALKHFNCNCRNIQFWYGFTYTLYNTSVDIHNLAFASGGIFEFITCYYLIYISKLNCRLVKFVIIALANRFEYNQHFFYFLFIVFFLVSIYIIMINFPLNIMFILNNYNFYFLIIFIIKFYWNSITYITKLV